MEAVTRRPARTPDQILWIEKLEARIAPMVRPIGD
jgi:hypothetical protein